MQDNPDNFEKRLNKHKIEDMAKKGYTDEKGCTALHKACEEGLNDRVMQLIKDGYDVNARDNSGRTPLSIAIEKGNDELVIMLIGRGADVSSLHITPEFVKSHPNLVKLLAISDAEGINSNLGVFATDKTGVEALKAYIEAGGDINAVNDQKQTLLMMCTDVGNIDAVKYAIEHNADLNKKDINGNTALMYSAKNGSHDISKLLLDNLDNKADVNLRNIEEKTAIMISVENNHLDVTKLLVEYEADISMKDKDGENVLTKAVKAGSLETVKFFIEECTDKENEQTNETKQENKAKKASLKSFVNEQDNKGFTAIMHAYKSNQIEMFGYLLQHSDLSIKGQDGLNIVDMVSQEKNSPFRGLLETKFPQSPELRINIARERLNISKKVKRSHPLLNGRDFQQNPNSL
ncbi:MAG: ankyrin repeat domain-containing protein [Lactobacillaceae bacterium]|jgi:ankyrin repeat protein|nr:ankyrin repeat domain-containing protein [Lactobacillaceae bacterium]